METSNCLGYFDTPDNSGCQYKGEAESHST